MRRLIGLLALGGLLAVMASGCGGGSSKPLDKAAYEKQMRAVGADLTKSLNALTASTGSATKAAAALVALQTHLRTAEKELGSITPPVNVKTQHADLVTALGEFADELDPVITQLKAGKMTALNDIGTMKGLNDIETASNAIAAKGYKIGT